MKSATDIDRLAERADLIRTQLRAAEEHADACYWAWAAIEGWGDPQDEARFAASHAQAVSAADRLRVRLSRLDAALAVGASDALASQRATRPPAPSRDELVSVSRAAGALPMRRADALRAVRESGAVVEVAGRKLVRYGELLDALAGPTESRKPSRPSRPRRARTAPTADPWAPYLT